MGEVRRLPTRIPRPAPPDCSVIRAWELLRAGARATHGTLGELVAMLDDSAPLEAVLAQVDLLNTQLAACGSAVTFLREAGTPPDAA